MSLPLLASSTDRRNRSRVALPTGLALVMIISVGRLTAASTDWPEYQGGPGRTQYSPLSQIDIDNVARLQPAWEFATGEPGEMQCNPLIIDGRLYGVTAVGGVFALDAATGKQLWRHKVEPPADDANWQDRQRILRGLTYWTDGDESRIFFAIGPWLHALDADTGTPVTSFGDDGRTSLRAGLGEGAQEKWVISTTPGALFEDLIIMPLRVSENADAAPGYIQAFDVRTGELAWVFRTIPAPGDPGSETWPETFSAGGANCWAGMTVDHERGVVFVPTGSATPDFWGGDRPGANLYANCLLALDARTGTLRWHFQFVRHDIWDRDLPASPKLVRVRRDGRMIDALAQVTKTGHVFVFDRDTGESLFPLEEVPVPASELPGEVTMPTQILPTLPAPFARQTFTEDDINPHAADRDELLTRFRAARHGLFLPFNLQETIVFPGYDGGASWGGAAVTPDGVLFVNAHEMAWIGRLKETMSQEELDKLPPGERLYALHCSACHGAERQGSAAGNFPALTQLAGRLTPEEIAAVITSGRGMMPGFPTLTPDDRDLLVDHLLDRTPATENRAETAAPASSHSRPPYELEGYTKFVDSQGWPAIAPPWGSLTAIDLNTGEHLWRITLGDDPRMRELGLPPTGTENYGGPVVTAGGVLFIAATSDNRFRAFNRHTGELLWEYELPASGFATPSTYEIDGRQYVVIAAGGTKLNTEKGDCYIAFALP